MCNENTILKAALTRLYGVIFSSELLRDSRRQVQLYERRGETRVRQLCHEYSALISFERFVETDFKKAG